MFISKFIKKYKNYKSYQEIHNWGEKSAKADFPNLDSDFPKITADEMKQIQATWPGIGVCQKDVAWIRIYKREHGFSPYAIGSYQSTIFRKILNPKQELHAFDNKALCDIYFPEIKYAKPFVRRIKNNFYDLEMNHLSTEQAIEILAAQKEYIIKPALDTLCGDGVHKVTLSEDKNKAIAQIKESFAQQSSDFIAQEVIKQHPEIARLNPSSFNCFRVTTVYINGKFDYCTILKVGKAIKGNFRDNWNSSYLIGVSNDGILNDFGYDNQINRVDQTDNGIKFGGLQMPMFKEIVASCEKWHKHFFPNCGMLGFDISLDDQNQIRVIEINVTEPGFVGEQLCCGTFFEPFRDDIVNHILGK